MGKMLTNLLLIPLRPVLRRLEDYAEKAGEAGERALKRELEKGPWN